MVKNSLDLGKILTLEMLLVLRNIPERAVEMQKYVFMYFKAFDKVRRGDLFENLGKLDLQREDLRLLQSVCLKQSASRVG